MLENEKQEIRDNYTETKKGLKTVNRIIFGNNEEIPDDWTDFELSKEETRILKEGETFIEKELIPTLSISRKFIKKGYKEDKNLKNEEKKLLLQEKETENELVQNKELSSDDIDEINLLLKRKARKLKLEGEELEYKKLKLKREEDEKKKRELETLNN